MSHHLLGKFFIDDDDLGVEVRGDAGQSGAVLRSLDLEIGIGKERGDRAQHHRSDKGSHRRDTLRHYDDDPVSGHHTVVLKCGGPPAGTTAKVAESHRLPLVFVNPGRHKWTVSGSCIERFDEITELHPTLLHSRKSSVLVTGASALYSCSLSCAGWQRLICDAALPATRRQS